MREIKFRTWDKRIKRMWDWQKIKGANPFLADMLADDYELMQYTGLKDKNGKEIYEGDILDCDDGARYLQVIWFEPQSCFDTIPIKVLKNNKFLALRNSAWSRRCEVIGDIYENPELVGNLKK